MKASAPIDVEMTMPKPFYGLLECLKAENSNVATPVWCHFGTRLNPSHMSSRSVAYGRSTTPYQRWQPKCPVGGLALRCQNDFVSSARIHTRLNPSHLPPGVVLRAANKPSFDMFKLGLLKTSLARARLV